MIAFLASLVGVLLGSLIGYLAVRVYPDNKAMAFMFGLLAIALAAALMILVNAGSVQQIASAS